MKANLTTPTGSQPLAGVRIVDLTSIVLGPLATLTLAGLGAEVIKIEAIEGDNVRLAGSAQHDDMGHVFLHGNRGKQSVSLNLKSADAQGAMLRLLATADVFICNVRPAAMRRLGFGPEALQELNPRLIQVTATGYGSRGPLAHKPAYDDLIQGAVGIPELMQRYTGSEPAYAPLSLVDRVTGLHAVYAVTAALYARERSGKGQYVEVPMFESAAHFVLADHLAGATFDSPLGAAGYDRLLSTNRRPYRTADGYLCVLIYNDKHWQSFLEAVGEPLRFKQDSRFSSQRSRSANIHEIYGFVAGLLKSRTTAEWCELLDRIDVPNQIPASLEELIDDPQLKASGLVGEEFHPTEGKLRTLGTPTYWNETQSPDLTPAPRLGEHTREVLMKIGYSPEEVQDMVQRGSIVCASQ